jgi:hypothetical protein
MRKLYRSLIVLAVLSPAAVVPACSGSSNNGPPGSTGPDGSTPVMDGGSQPTADGSKGNNGDSATPTDAGHVSDTGPTTMNDSGVFGASCPPVDPTGFAEGPHGPLPTVVYQGGAVLTAPQIITFTFPTTRGISTLQSFGQTVTASPWFAEVMKDYCVADGGPCIGAGAAGVSVAISTAAAPLYIDMMGQGTATGGVDLDSFINQQIAAAVAAKTIPAPGPNSLYAFYFPTTSTITMGEPDAGGGASCSAFGGYHSNITYTDGTTQIVYAIMPDCDSGDPVADLQNVTVAASHEIAEAATDPHVGTNEIGWYLDQAFVLDAGVTVPQLRNEPWANADSFGEVGDNCESLLFQTWPLDSGVQVQRIWSPSAASAGHNPCVPVPAGESYYNTSTDKVLYVADVGTSFTVDVTGFSDVSRPSWRLDGFDVTATQQQDGQGNPLPYLKLEFVNEPDAGDGVAHFLCMNNKTQAQLKVTLLADPAQDPSLNPTLGGSQTWPEADGIIYSADVANAFPQPLPDGGTSYQFPYQPWPFAVVTPAIAKSIGVGDGGVVDARHLGAIRAGMGHHAQPPRHAIRRPKF